MVGGVDMDEGDVADHCLKFPNISLCAWCFWCFVEDLARSMVYVWLPSLVCYFWIPTRFA